MSRGVLWHCIAEPRSDSIVHARTSYEDYPEPERKRHLLRLWLSARNGRQLPAAFAERFGDIEVGKIRGGVRVSGQTLHAPLEAE